MIEFDAATIRITLHLLAVSVWVGGQIVMAALVPALRTLGDDAPKMVAQQFSRVAWPFFSLAVITGVWNLLVVDVAATSVSYQATLGIKLLLVAASGVAAFVHAETGQRVVKAVTGAGSLVMAIAAVVCGVMLST